MKISCNICMDLIPLVRDGIASPDSEAAVREHIAHCESCRSLFSADTVPVPDTAKSFQKLRSQLRLFGAMIILFGIVVGLSLSGSGDLFYNVLLMPAMGAIGYWLFRWKALIGLPVLLFSTHCILNALGIVWQGEHLNLMSLVLWSSIYAGLTAVGTVIAGLLHFALRKEIPNETQKNT